MLRAIGFYGFLENPELADGLNDSEQAILLMLLRDSLKANPQATIAWIQSPKEAYILLGEQYSYSLGLQRDSLYRDFHSLTFSGHPSNLAAFNAKFNSLISKLQLAGATVEPIDQINQYLAALEKAFPQ